MKLILTVFAIAGIALAGCNSDRNNNTDADSLMTDTSIIDTASNPAGGGIADTTKVVDTSMTRPDSI